MRLSSFAALTFLSGAYPIRKTGIHFFGICAAMLTLAAPLPASAQDEVASFYKGKQITLQVGSDAGGEYDVIARTVARHMGKHIPGQPMVVVQNVPGSGGLKLLNQLYAVGAR